MSEIFQALGNVGSVRGLETLNSGAKVFNFTLCSNTYRGPDKEPKKMWLNCSVWNEFAESIGPHIEQGKKLLVKGELLSDENGTPGTYEHNGETRSSFRMRVDSIEFAGGSQDQKPVKTKAEEDDIPW